MPKISTSGRDDGPIGPSKSAISLRASTLAKQWCACRMAIVLRIPAMRPLWKSCQLA